MIVTKLKPWEEISGYLEGESKIFLLACKGCADVCQTGSEAQVTEIRQKLEQEGKTVTGYTIISFLCDKGLARMRLTPHEEKIMTSDSLLAICCGIGVQATSAVVDKMVHPACNSINLGGVQGLWPGAERCRECGDCVLDMTGGICPLTACAKGLLNGPCGGSRNGKCEAEPTKDCGWHLIYQRLEKLGRLDKWRERAPIIKDYSKMETPKELWSTIMQAPE
jgi:ferredoxin